MAIPAHHSIPSNGDNKKASDNQPDGFTLSPADVKAVDELCHILARVLMRVNAEKQTPSNSDQGAAD